MGEHGRTQRAAKPAAEPNSPQLAVEKSGTAHGFRGFRVLPGTPSRNAERVMVIRKPNRISYVNRPVAHIQQALAAMEFITYARLCCTPAVQRACETLAGEVTAFPKAFEKSWSVPRFSCRFFSVNRWVGHRPISISSISFFSKSLTSAEKSTPLALASAARVACTF